ncbi:DEAD/DEAH box helicase [Amycolatopsis sp. NPDC004079]|uniref:DEAD/DEAH box helicase n=1 Tax=Amycolatopsis sp. NPDC004079 TaxID=3154549 RepID=UPI0033B5BBC7
MPAGPDFDELREKLAADDVAVRQVRYLVEDEVVIEGNGKVSATSSECALIRPVQREFAGVSGSSAKAARDAFTMLWDTHAPVDAAASGSMPADQVVPAEWLRYLPHHTLNPAQAEAIPRILDGREHMVVVAPTGAGKTVIGMAAVLRTVLGEGRKAVWLVPQRSLTDELDRELEHWRRTGMRVERLSGEYSTDIQRLRDADVWVATTEKFEAVCRTTSLREALAEVGCLVVDEIHLLGDVDRGPVLEALLARMRGSDSQMRIVGLSATVSNADGIADWLGARLVRVAWRPSKLTWQLPAIAAHRDWSLVETSRIRLASAITKMITRDNGSVLVFCGSKRNVRRTALVIAGSRGVEIGGVHPDDLDRLREVCDQAGVGLHYKGWEHRREAEKAFRAREIDVLVATTTVAAGVNLPARAVVIQDTEVGMNPIDVATVQQMFGRAGRIGVGEHEGWAFLIVTEEERAAWQARLVDGHEVASRIEASLADHVLAEAIQHRIRSLREAEEWWAGTLAHHQGSRSPQPLRAAVEFLVDAEYLTETAADGEVRLTPTELGKLTARLMVPVEVGRELRLALADAPLPDSPAEAERTLVDVVSELVPKLRKAAITEPLKEAVDRLLRPGGDSGYQPGDLARAALLMVAGDPGLFRRPVRSISGIPHTALYQVLEEAPRYLHWISTQGQLGTVHPWCAIVAGDLSRRVKWRRCGPPRGAGRLLWIFEQMATPPNAEELVPELWRAARARGLRSPDWTATGRPRHCRLDDEDYQALLRERATAVTIDLHSNRTNATAPEGSVLLAWAGRAYRMRPVTQGKASIEDHEADGSQRTAAVFTWRGDHRATGWLREYSELADR